MSRTTLQLSFVLIALILNGITQIEAASSSDAKEFLQKIGYKISQAAVTIKEYLLELFYRFRAFFTGHTESTHIAMTSKGCGYAADDQPAIYNKHSAVIGKIKGGDNAIWHTWPWIVALYTGTLRGWSCAGVLVNQNTIITAAHCVTETTPSDMKAVIGVHTVLGKLNPLNYYSISSIHRHPENKKCCKNDLAVLKLTKPVLYGPKINSVCLPFEPYATIDHGNALTNQTGVIIGWGDTSQSPLTNMYKSLTLQQANVHVLDDYYCRRAYGYVFDSSTEICAGDYDQRTDTMSGDSGGPLLIRQTDGRWVVLGITSYGAPKADTFAPGVYVKLSAFTKWLRPFVKTN